MQALLLLADSAQADQAGKVHALGIGWSQTGSPTPPLAILLFIDCPWDQTNRRHKIEITLLDADGHPVSFETGPLGQPVPAVLIEAEFEAGRPPGAPRGTSLRQTPLVINLGPGLPLVPGQKYEFHLKINGEHMDSSMAAFHVREQ